ncbi:MAG TPA: hypothetical protein VLN48_21585 [Bryobacteraceae bacterium]|nr:hypothetical protein [Bryobacteraceae bacterium]
MRKTLTFLSAAAALFCGSLLLMTPDEARAQTAPAKAVAKGPRMPDGKPNFNGVWQAITTANWDIQDHSAAAGPFWQLGAIGAIPAGQGIVEGNEIPYTPAGLAKKKQNKANWPAEDPEAKCYMPGIPRANYMPFPFQIIQSNKDILMAYEYASANRLINMGKPVEAGSDTWMGTSNGRWEGDTLVVDVTGLNGLAWFDRAGNWGSDKLHIVERYHRTSNDVLNYEATLEDPSVYTKAWKISLPLYKRAEKNAQILEFKCVEFAEELLYGKYKKQPTK